MNEKPIYKTLTGIVAYLNKEEHQQVDIGLKEAAGVVAGDLVYVAFPQHPSAQPLSGKVVEVRPLGEENATLIIEQNEDVNDTYRRLDKGGWKEVPFHARVKRETLSWLIREMYFDDNYPGDTEVEFLPDGSALVVGTIPQEEEEAA